MLVSLLAMDSHPDGQRKAQKGIDQVVALLDSVILVTDSIFHVSKQFDDLMVPVRWP